jgi:hypothetical protein
MVSSTTSALSELPNMVFGGGSHKYAIVNGSSVTILVPAVVGMKIRLLAGLFVSTDNITARVITIQSKETDESAVDLTGAMSAQQNVNIVLPFSPAGWLETSAGDLLQMSTTGTFTGCIVYDEVAG